MLQYVSRKALDTCKYNTCVEQSIQSNIFGYSWYLDVVADNWGVLVYNDYEAVMPLPFRKKGWINYVYPPLWLIQLGIYSKEGIGEEVFLEMVFKKFRFVETRINAKNNISEFKQFQEEKQLQILGLNCPYDDIRKNYNRNRKRELEKAVKADLTEHWNDAPSVLVDLFKENVGKRVSNIKARDYENLLELLKVCVKKKVGELLTIYDRNNHIVSAAFFLKHQNRVTELVCSSDFKNRDNGANTFMNDRAIYKYQKHFELFDFGGSSMKTIAKYYRSFGAHDECYTHLKYNNLAGLLKLVKR